MPDDRLFHPRMRRSRKVGALSYLEKWVWLNMIFSADNYGVLPDRAALLIGADDSLEASEDTSPGCVRAAMDVVIHVGLFIPFEHQDQRYLCDPVWQDYQKIQYPKATYYPAPTGIIFDKLSRNSQILFKESHPSLRKKSKPLSRETLRLEARGLRLTAKGSGLSEEGSGEEAKLALPATTESSPAGTTAPARGRSDPAKPWCTPEELVKFYNEQAPATWSRFKKLTPGRAKKLAAYLKAFPEREFWEAIIVVEPLRSPFLLGKRQTLGRKPFVGSLDWLVQRGKEDGIENCAKVYEGKYRDGEDTHGPATSTPEAVSRSAPRPRNASAPPIGPVYDPNR